MVGYLILLKNWQIDLSGFDGGKLILSRLTLAEFDWLSRHRDPHRVRREDHAQTKPMLYTLPCG